MNAGPYTCSVCQKAFAHKMYLKKHLLIHTVGKLYLCDIGQTSFKYIRSLRKHRNLHSGVRHTCTVCQKHFAQKSYLKIHMKTHTEKNGLSCNYRQKRFTFKSNLKTHVQKMHLGDDGAGRDTLLIYKECLVE